MLADRGPGVAEAATPIVAGYQTAPLLGGFWVTGGLEESQRRSGRRHGVNLVLFGLAGLVAGTLLAACTPTAGPGPTPPPAIATPAALPAGSGPTSPDGGKSSATTRPAPTSASAIAVPTKSSQEAVAQFYQGKNVRIIVGFGAGGIIDASARVIGRQLSRFLPGQPTIVVQNAPGAASITAANLVYNAEPKDGTVILATNANIALQQAMGIPSIDFDAGKFQWLGSPNKSATACAVRTGLGVENVQDLRDKVVVLGASGPGANSNDVPVALNAVLGTRFKIVTGYPDVANVRLAFDQREVDGYCASFDFLSGLHRDLFEGEKPAARILIIMGDQPPNHPFLQGVPAAESLATSEEDRSLLRLVDTPGRLAYPLAVAPGVPEDRVAALREALAATFADPAYRADAVRAQVRVDPNTADDATRVIQDVVTMPASVRARLKDVLGIK